MASPTSADHRGKCVNTGATSPVSTPRRRASTLFNLLFASIGYVAIRMVIAPVRIKLLTSLLSKEDYGLLTLVMLTVSFITLLASLGSLEFMLRKLPGRAAAWQWKTLRTVTVYFGLLVASLGIIAAVTLIAWRPESLGLTTANIVACGLILVMTMHLTQLAYFLIGRSQYAQSRLLLIFQADAWFLPLLGFMWFVNISVSFMLWLWAAWLLLTLLLSQVFVSSRKVFKGRPSRALFRQILRFGLPLMPMIMGEWIFQIQDRYMLLAFAGLEAVANFTLCFNIAWVGFMTSVSMLDVLITEFYKARNQVHATDLSTLVGTPALRKAFTMMLRYGLAICIPVVLALWLARVPIVLLLSDPKFSDAAGIMPWVAPLPLLYLMVIITGRTLMAIDRGAIVGIGTLGAAALHLGMHLLLTPLMAERGAALAGCIAYGALAIYLGYRVRLFRWIEWPDLQPLRMAAFAVVSGLAIHGTITLLPGRHFIGLAVAGVACLAAMLMFKVARLADIHHIIASIQAAPPDASTTP